MGSISHHIMPLVINSLRGGHTHATTHKSLQIFVDRSNSKKPGACQPACTWLKKKVGIAIISKETNS